MPYLLFLALFFPVYGWSYPQFIGYGYSSCLTCHFNGNGNGPLNDYGRALWAAEIAGKFLSGGASDEQLAEASGFLGKVKMPDMIRPGLKARQLIVQRNPGGTNEITEDILMQADANVVFLLDKQQKKAVVLSAGLFPADFKDANPSGETWITREHYFRWQPIADLWLYMGLMDKAYGIRHADHTAYSRSRTGLGQNDQSHGVIAHMVKPKWEGSFGAFMGNLMEEAEFRQKGFSVTYEYEVRQSWRLGASALHSTGENEGNVRYGFHGRLGFEDGASLLLETGFIEDIPKAGTSSFGYYFFSELMQRIRRGYHVFVAANAYKDKLERGRSNYLRLNTGFLIFPMSRVEFRIEAENTRVISTAPNVQKDSWAILGQWHLSL